LASRIVFLSMVSDAKLTLSKRAETIFQQAVKVKNRVLSCNMIRWFSLQLLKPCWLLMQY